MKNERFYVKRSTGKVFGPFDRNAIQLMLKSGKLSADAELSTDKASWQAVTEIEDFAQHVSVLPPDLKTDNPRATMLSGWRSGSTSEAEVSKPDLPTPRASAPPDLPAAKPPAIPGLPIPKGAPDLPARKSVPDLPTPRALGGGVPDLPAAKSAPDLPAPKGPTSGLPIPKSPSLPTRLPDLPTPVDEPLPSPAHNLPLPKPKSFDEDLFGSGASASDDDDLFGTPSDDDDLFGAPNDDDLFGSPLDKPAPAPVTDDLFSVPGSAAESDIFGASAAAESDIFGSTPAAGRGADELFGDAGDSDLFGVNAPVSDDDLFESAPAGKGDDFLSGDAGFSFLDDNPQPSTEDEWGNDLFDDGFDAPEARSEASSPLDDWGDDLLDQPSAPPRASASASAPIHDPADPFRPASAGIRKEEPAEAPKDSSVAQDRKRGGASGALIGVFAAVVLGAGGYAIYNAMSSTEQPVEVNTPVAKVTSRVTIDMLKSDNYADYAILNDAAAKPAAGEEGLWLLAHSMYLARFTDEKAVERAEPIAQQLKDAKDGMDAVGRGAYEARSGQADAARAYLESQSGESGDLGFFANLAAGFGDVKAMEIELARAVAIAMPLPSRDIEVGVDGIAPHVEGDEPENNAAGEALAATGSNGTGTNEVGTNGAETNGATNNAAAPSATPAHLARLDERARTALDAASKIDPESPLPYYWRGVLERALNQNAAALTALKKGAELGPQHVGTNLQLGAAYYENGDLNQAIELLEKIAGELSAQAGPSERAEALHYAGLVHVARRDSDLAVEAFTKSLDIDASREDTLRALAEEYERAQKYKEALTFFTTNKDLAKNDPNVMLGIVRSHIGLEQWQNAAATLEEGERSFPDDAQFPYYRGQLYMRRGAFADAQKPLERAVEIDPGLLTAHATLAQLAWRMDKDLEKGERHIREIVARPNGIDAEVATEVAEYYNITGRRETAEKWYREALRRDRNNWLARLSLSRLLLEEGKQDQARELLERARQEGVQDVRLSAYLADAYRQAKEYDRAVDEINQVIEAFPKAEEYVFIRGRIHYDRGNFDTARDDFQRAYDLNPRFHDAYFFVGRTSFEQGDYQNALKIFRHVLDYKPDNGNYRFYMARTLETEGRLTQALEEYRKATAVDPAFGIENPMVYVYRGQLLSRLNYSREGKADIARALELVPNDVIALRAMGDAEYRDKAYRAAILHYEKALSIEPNQPETQAKLGFSLVYTDQRVQAAQRFQQAIKYGHDDPEVFKTLGYLYKELGQRSQAKEAFTMFLKRAEDRGDVPVATKREIMGQLEGL